MQLCPIGLLTSVCICNAMYVWKCGCVYVYACVPLACYIWDVGSKPVRV